MKVAAEDHKSQKSKFVALNRIYNDRGDLKKALAAGEIALDLYPDSSEANVTMRITYILADDAEKALALFKKANEIEPRVSGTANDLNRNAAAWLCTNTA